MPDAKALARWIDRMSKLKFFDRIKAAHLKYAGLEFDRTDQFSAGFALGFAAGSKQTTDAFVGEIEKELLLARECDGNA